MSFIINPYRFGPPAFSPSDLASLDLWLQGDNASINGVPEFDWPDSSPNAKHYGQNTVARQPSIASAAYNGHSAVRFAANKCLVPDPTALGHSAANTMIAVCTKSSAAEYIIKGSGGQGGPAIISEFGGVDFEYFFTGTAGHERATFAAAAAGLRILTVTHTDNTGNYEGYLDGNPTPVFSNPIHTSDDWDPQTLTIIGAFTAGTSVYDGDIAEILHFNAVLSAGDLADVHDYLKTKYGIA